MYKANLVSWWCLVFRVNVKLLIPPVVFLKEVVYYGENIWNEMKRRVKLQCECSFILNLLRQCRTQKAWQTPVKTKAPRELIFWAFPISDKVQQLRITVKIPRGEKQRRKESKSTFWNGLLHEDCSTTLAWAHTASHTQYIN